MLSMVAYTNESGDVDLVASCRPKKATMLFTKRLASVEEIKRYIERAKAFMKPETAELVNRDREVSPNPLFQDPRLAAMLERDDREILYYKNRCTAKIGREAFFRIFEPVKQASICTLIVEFDTDLQQMEVELVFHAADLVPKKFFYAPEDLDCHNLTVMDALTFFQFDWLQ